MAILEFLPELASHPLWVYSVMLMRRTIADTCPRTLSVPRSERFYESSRKIVSFDEQIMPKDKYASIFSSQMEAVVFIIFQIFFATLAVLKIVEYHSDIPQF